MKKILVVEDDPMILKMLRLVLLDYELFIASDGATGIEKALEIKPHLILMDLSLPGIDGYKAVKEIKGNPETSQIPVIALTARKIPIGEIRAEGFDNYQEKPFSPDDLIKKIELLLNC